MHTLRALELPAAADMRNLGRPFMRQHFHHQQRCRMHAALPCWMDKIAAAGHPCPHKCVPWAPPPQGSTTHCQRCSGMHAALPC